MKKVLGKNSAGKPGIIIGAELAKNLFLKKGDTVMMVSPVGVVTPMGLVPRTKKFQVVGIFPKRLLSVRCRALVYLDEREPGLLWVR